MVPGSPSSAMSALIFLFCLVAGAFADNATVQVSVYYESLCSDSIKFFVDRLIPTYTQKDYNFYSISPDVKIVPYGKVTDYHNETVICQHGESECNGNKLHACAIKYISDQKVLLNYIGCLMKATTPVNKTIPYPSPDKVCSTEAGTALPNITNCYNGDEGKTLFNNNGEVTTKFFGNNNFSVPFIAFNNKYDPALSTSAIDNFRKTLCAQVGLNNDFCSDVPKSGAAMLSAPFALISAILFSFYAAQ